MRTLPWMTSLSLLLVLSLGPLTAQDAAQEEPAEPSHPADETLAPELPPLTLARVTELLRAGMTSEMLGSMVQESGSVFDLSVEDVIRLARLGASPELIQLMTRSKVSAQPIEEPPPPTVERAASGGTLTFRKILRMHRKGVPSDQIAQEIATKGLKEPIDLDQLQVLSTEGVSEDLILAMTSQTRPADAPASDAATEGTSPASDEPAQRPMKTGEIRRMLQRREAPETIVSAIRTRGITSPPSLQDAVEFRQLGATDEILAAINTAALALEEEEEEEEEDAEDEVETAAPATREKPLPGLSPTAGVETLTILSYPSGARVYLSPARTRLEDRLRHDYLVGRTPVSVTLPPGDYSLIVEKRAGPFEAGLLPAWRTMHDPPGIRSLLDDTDLTFNPTTCCLPGSLSGVVNLRPIPEEQPRAIIGDQFDGLPPYLFDGEALQILRVRRSQITDVMKLYHVRKIAGQARAVIASFLPAEGDPLEIDPTATPTASFESELGRPELQHMLGGPAQPQFATALGVEAERLAAAIAVMSKTGKVILHEQVPGGVRLLTLAIDYNSRLRVTEQTVLPHDPFAPTPVNKGKRRPAPISAPIPPLPGLERTVVPGLGSPRLSLVNPGPSPAALIFDDGEFCYAGAGVTTECVIDPGSHQVRVMSGGEVRGGGPLHLSYHSRYTMKLPPMRVR